MGWIFSKIPSHLPKPTGPYQVSCVDIFTEHSVDGILLRLYYPSLPVDQYRPNYDKWVPWLPAHNYATGFAKLWSLAVFLVHFILWLSGNVRIPIEYGNTVLNKENEKLKCIIFSHGIGGARFPYSTILTEIASRGFLVVAIEHRDETSCHTWYYENDEAAATKRKTMIEYKPMDFYNREFYNARNAQVMHRVQECGKAIDFVKSVERGDFSKYMVQPYFANEELKFDFKLDELVERIDLNTLTMMGQSFGAATSLVTLTKRPELRQGIILDPWMFPIHNMTDLHQDVKQPLIFLNTETFHSEENVQALKIFYTESSPNMYTVLKTSHENQADGIFIAGWWLNMFKKMLPPLTSHKIHYSLILKFLNEKINYPPDSSDCVNCLNEQSLHFAASLPKPWVEN